MNPSAKQRHLGTGRAVPQQFDKPPQKTAAEPMKKTDRTTESPLDIMRTDTDFKSHTYFVTTAPGPIDEKTKMDFEVPPDKVAFLSKPTYWVRDMVGSTKLVMHPTKYLVPTGVRMNLANGAYLKPQWRRKIQQFPTPKARNSDEATDFRRKSCPADRPNGRLKSPCLVRGSRKFGSGSTTRKDVYGLVLPRSFCPREENCTLTHMVSCNITIENSSKRRREHTIRITTGWYGRQNSCHPTGKGDNDPGRNKITHDGATKQKWPNEDRKV